MSKYSTTFVVFFNVTLILFIFTILLYQENLTETLNQQTPVQVIQVYSIIVFRIIL